MVPLTLVIGMHYNGGVVLVSDSRIMEGPDYRTEQKIFYATNNIVISSSGLNDILRQLIDEVRGVPNIEVGFMSVRRAFENVERGLYYWYKGGSQPYSIQRYLFWKQ